MILSNVDHVPGVTIRASLGLIVACVPYFGVTYLEGIKDLKGVTVADVSAVFEHRRAQAVNRLVAKALERGADGVIGITFDHRDITSSWKELCIYGTAVRFGRPVTRGGDHSGRHSRYQSDSFGDRPDPAPGDVLADPPLGGHRAL